MKRLGAYLLLAVLLEALRLSWFARMPAHPDFLFGLVIMIALLRPSPAGAWVGLTLGLARDLIYGATAGTNAFPLAVIGWTVGSLGRSVYREALLTQMLVLFAAGLVKGGVGYLVLSGGEVEGLFSYLARIALPSSLETAILVPLVYNLVRDVWDVKRLRRLVTNGLKAYETKIFVKR